MKSVSDSLVKAAKGLNNCAGKAMDALYKSADFALNKTIYPVCDSFGEYCAKSFFSNPNIPEGRKFQAVRRNFIADDSAVLGEAEYPTGKPAERKEMSWKEIAALGAAAMITLGAAAYAKKKDFGADDVDDLIAGAKAEISAADSGFAGFLTPNRAPVIENIVANNTEPRAGDIVRFDARVRDPDGDTMSYKWQILQDEGLEVDAKTTSAPALEEKFDRARKYTVKLEASDGRKAGAAQMELEVGEKVVQHCTSASDCDYYDEEFKVGIMIEGDDGFKRNVSNIMKTWKEVDLEVYREMITNKLAPKKIDRSPDMFSRYGSDTIGLPDSIERMGGSDNIEIRKSALPNLYTEWDNALTYKSGNTKTLIEQEKTKLDYGVRIGIWTEETANRELEIISEKIKCGTYFDNSAFPKETIEKFKKDNKC